MPDSCASSTRCVAAAERSASTISSCCAGSREAGHWTAGPRPSCFSSRQARRQLGSSRSASDAVWLRGAEVAAPSAGSPARGSRRCGGPRGGRCPGRRGVGAPAVDCGSLSRNSDPHRIANHHRTPGLRLRHLRSSVTSLTRASVHTSSVSMNLWLFVCRTNLHRSPTTSRGIKAARNTRY